MLVPVDPGKKKGIYTDTICLLIIIFCHCAWSLFKWTDGVIEISYVCEISKLGRVAIGTNWGPTLLITNYCHLSMQPHVRAIHGS